MTKFKDTDLTYFVDRNPEGAIVGVYTQRQAEDQEEILAVHPEIVAFHDAAKARQQARIDKEKEMSSLLEELLSQRRNARP